MDETIPIETQAEELIDQLRHHYPESLEAYQIWGNFIELIKKNPLLLPEKINEVNLKYQEIRAKAEAKPAESEKYVTAMTDLLKSKWKFLAQYIHILAHELDQDFMRNHFDKASPPEKITDKLKKQILPCATFGHLWPDLVSREGLENLIAFLNLCEDNDFTRSLSFGVPLEKLIRSFERAIPRAIKIPVVAEAIKTSGPKIERSSR